MDKPPKYPGFTALLPPRVRYDKELPATAKLLYAEISAMADVTGFCWATNRYLGDLYTMSKRTVTRLLEQLEAKGYIEIQVLRDDQKAVTERRLYLTDAGLMRLPPIVKNVYRGMVKNDYTPIDKNVTTTMNNTSNNNPPIVPQRGTRSTNPHKDAPDWKPEAFEKLWKWYPTGEMPRPAPRGNRQRAIRAWDKLHPDDALIAVISRALARQAESEQWQKGVGIPHLSTYLNQYGWEGWEDGEDG